MEVFIGPHHEFWLRLQLIDYVSESDQASRMNMFCWKCLDKQTSGGRRHWNEHGRFRHISSRLVHLLNHLVQ